MLKMTLGLHKGYSTVQLLNSFVVLLFLIATTNAGGGKKLLVEITRKNGENISK